MSKLFLHHDVNSFFFHQANLYRYLAFWEIIWFRIYPHTFFMKVYNMVSKQSVSFEICSFKEFCCNWSYPQRFCSVTRENVNGNVGFSCSLNLCYFLHCICYLNTRSTWKHCGICPDLLLFQGALVYELWRDEFGNFWNFPNKCTRIDTAMLVRCDLVEKFHWLERWKFHFPNC